MQILVTPKRRYGRTDYVPACELSWLLCKLAGQSVLTVANLELVKAHGVEVVEQP